MPNDFLRTQMSYYDEFLYETRLCAYKPIGAGSFFCYSILSQLFLSILKTFAVTFQSTLSLTLLTFLVFRKKKEKKPCAYQEKKKAKKQSWKCKNEREQMEVTAADVPGTKACQRIMTTHDCRFCLILSVEEKMATIYALAEYKATPTEVACINEVW